MRRALLGAFLLLGIGVALLTPSSNAVESLESRIESATGIVRNIDAGLQSRAANRAIQIQTDFSHCCLAYGEAEVIAWNRGYEDPVGQLVIGWLGSSSHAALLLDPGYVDIGCAVAVGGDTTYGVCLFRYRTTAPSATPTPVQPPVLPDTAMP